MQDAPDLEMVYIGDPMCSWCWGFAPTLHKLDETFDIPLRTMVGGLAAGPMARPMGPNMTKTILHHWHQVEEASGQPFDHTGLDRPPEWVYDTELACTAVVVVRQQAPEKTLAFFDRLHRAFYAEAIDITDIEVYPALVADFVPDVDAFMVALKSSEMHTAAWEDFSAARRLGVSGFPTLLVRDGEQWSIVCRGFAPFENIEPAIRGWLAERRGGSQSDEMAEGAHCEVGSAEC